MPRGARACRKVHPKTPPRADATRWSVPTHEPEKHLAIPFWTREHGVGLAAHVESQRPGGVPQPADRGGPHRRLAYHTPLPPPAAAGFELRLHERDNRPARAQHVPDRAQHEGERDERDIDRGEIWLLREGARRGR